MMIGRRKLPQAKESSNGRVAVVAAAIFLLALCLIARLIYIQGFQHSKFLSLAQGQHKTSYELLPDRGKILIQENYFNPSSGLYPIATNKEFALVYAMPREVEDASGDSEKLYEFFHKEEVEKKVDKIIEQERKDKLDQDLEAIGDIPEEERILKEQEVKTAHEVLMKDQLWLDVEKQHREDLIREEHDKIVNEYTKKLEQADDVYEPIQRKLDEEKLKNFYLFMLGRNDIKAEDLIVKNEKVFVKDVNGEELKIKGFSYTTAPYRFYPENNIGSHILGYASYENEEQHGKYGLEGFFDQELFGKYGSVTAERGAGGLVIVNDRKYDKKEDGSSLVLTIDRSAQFTACKMLDESVAKHGAEGGSVIVVDPKTGAILVMCSAPDFDPNNYQEISDIKFFNNPAVFAQYEPGSVFKAITMAAALDSGKVTPETTYQDKGQVMINGWPKPIKNSDFDTFGGHGTTNMVTVLEQSLNTGAIFAMQQTGVSTFADYVKKFGFGEKTGIELEGESAGNIKPITALRVKDISAATASFGQGITVTPLQMVMSYAAIANGGELMKPYIVKEIVAPDGKRFTTKTSMIRRVISQKTAAILSGILVNVVENGHSKKIQIPGYYIAGKTGTAQVAAANSKGYSGKYNHTFVGFAPANNSTFVILTKLDNPRAMYAESTAVPLAHDITAFLLNHWQVKKERPIETNTKK